jgi:hypothetical protein
MVRRLLLVLGLSAAGAVFGALAAMLLTGGLGVATELMMPSANFPGARWAALRSYLEVLTLAAAVGAPLGAVLAPAAALTFMRHVPLWRLFLEPTLGAALGGALGLVLPVHVAVMLMLGAAGALAAAARLAKAASRSTAAQPSRLQAR